ncbi:Rad52/Rad22 family DNA repair protein [Nonomuraea sp. JJY05]|uniref:Rad52/Rad22 family DNA repair protein n=1 Tax=Nonomuraea sp. JJY05 TaxID=3350255 RepID=UPI00373E7FF7
MLATTTKLARKLRPRGFLRKQIRQLLKPIAPERVMRDGKGHSHITQQDNLAHLNRVFGFGNWDTDLLRLDLVFEQERTDKPGRWDVCYRAVVRLTVKDPYGNVMCHYENGTAETAQNQTRGDAHELAMKSAISVATKRASIPLGDQFGLSLYNKGQTSALVDGTLVWPDPTPEEIAAHQAAQAGGTASEEPEDIQANVPQQVSLGYDETDRPLNADTGPSLLSRIIVAISGATSLDQMTAIGNQIDAEIAAGHVSKADEQAIGAVFMPKRELLLAVRDTAHRANQVAQAAEPMKAGV